MINYTILKNPRLYERNKEWFKTLKELEESFTNDLLSLLASNYDTNIPSTLYGLHYKALAREFSQFIIDSQEVVNDLFPDISRLEAIWKNLGSYLGEPGKGFPPHEVDINTNEDYRDLLLAIKFCLLGGSTYDNLKEGMRLFLGENIEVYEEYLEPPDEIAKTFMFRVQVLIPDDLSGQYLLTRAFRNAQKLLNLVKPAHTLGRVVPTFTEEFHIYDCNFYRDENGNLILFSGAEHPYEGAFTLNDVDLYYDFLMSESIYMARHHHVGLFGKSRLKGYDINWKDKENLIITKIQNHLHRDSSYYGGPFGWGILGYGGSNFIIVNLGEVRGKGWLNFDYTGNRFLWPHKPINTSNRICESSRIFRVKRDLENYNLDSIQEDYYWTEKISDTYSITEEVSGVEFVLGPSGSWTSELNTGLDILGPIPTNIQAGDPTITNITIEYTEL